MDLDLFFALLGSLLVLAFLANRLVRFTRVPDVIILMATGVLIGPVLHWINPEIFRGAAQGFGALALILILFEGGLDLKLGEILTHLAPGAFLSISSYALSMAAVAVVAHWIFHFSWLNALLIGAILGCISSSILLPVLQQISVRRELSLTLLVEASLGDALAVLTVTTLLDIGHGGSANPKTIAWSLGSSLVLALACGILVGMLWTYLLPILSEERFWRVLTFAAVLLVYSGVHLLKGNELVAVLAFGVTLANFKAIRKRLHLGEQPGFDWAATMSGQQLYENSRLDDTGHDQMLTFHGELAFLLRTFFFVLLGMLVDYAGLRKNLVFAGSCFCALLVARAAAVQAGRPCWRRFTSRERELMVWLIPRGLITAVLGIQVVQDRGAELAFLPSFAFAIILLTNLVLLVGAFRAQSVPVPLQETPQSVVEA